MRFENIFNCPDSGLQSAFQTLEFEKIAIPIHSPERLSHSSKFKSPFQKVLLGSKQFVNEIVGSLSRSLSFSLVLSST